MSQPHINSTQSDSQPVRMAIFVTIGAVGLIVGIVMLAQFAVGSHRVGENDAKANTPEAIAQRIAPLTKLALEPAKEPVQLVKEGGNTK